MYSYDTMKLIETICLRPTRGRGDENTLDRALTVKYAYTALFKCPLF